MNTRMGSRNPVSRRSVLVALVAVGLALLLGLPSAALAVAPNAATFDATSTNATAADVDGLVNPSGQSTTIAVQWGLASSTWCKTDTGSAPNTTAGPAFGFTDNSFHFVTVALTGLTSGTKYCAQLIGTNANGEGDGGQLSWTQGVPLTQTNDAFSSGGTTATVEGSVDPAGQSGTQYYAEYDTASSSWCTGGASDGTTQTTTSTALGFGDTSAHNVSVDVNGLTPGDVYCAEIFATNGSGTSADSGQVTWTQGLPSADTFFVSSTDATSATVVGQVDPAGQDTHTYVEYDVQGSSWCGGGATDGTTQTTSPVDLGQTNDTFDDVQVALTGLTGGTAYCAEIFATNGSGTSADSGLQQWTQGLPSATTVDVKSTGATTATVDGSINPVGQDTHYYVEWDDASSTWCTNFGASGSPANTTPVLPGTDLGFTDDTIHSVTVALSGLTSGQQYCAAVVAANGSGETDGHTTNWTQGAPVAVTTDAESTGGTTASVNGTVDPVSQDTEYFAQYGLFGGAWCSSGGTSGSPSVSSQTLLPAATGNGDQQVSVDLTGLTPGDNYCAQLVATNASGESDGGPVEWIEGSPTVDTTAAVSTSATGATVSGDVNPAGQDTQWDVVYDIASSNWCTSGGSSGSPSFSTTLTDLGFTDTSAHDVSANLNGLTADSSYCAAIEATNAAGTVDGFQEDWTQGVPTVDITGASGASWTTAAITGDVDAAGQHTTYDVEYALASSLFCTSFGAAGSPTTTTATDLGFTDGSSHPVTVDLSGLTANTSYCAEIAADNATGDAASTTQTWTQPASAPAHTLSATLAGGGSGTVTSSPAGVDCVSGASTNCSQQFNDGTPITLTATPAAGSSFVGFSGGTCTSTGATTCQVTLGGSDEAVTATFNGPPPPPNTITVTLAGTGSGSVASSPAGISCGSTCAHAFAQGAPVTLTATPAAGSTFTGFTGGTCVATSAYTCQVTPAGSDETVKATFTANTVVTHTLAVQKAGSGAGTVGSNPTGLDCGSTCTHTYNASASVTLTATPAPGSTFVGWSGAGCSGTGTCIVPMSADTTVTATFATSSSGGGGGGGGGGGSTGGGASCKVPKVTGHTLAAARRAIAKAHCKVGRVKKVHSTKKRRGKVVSERPGAGKKLRAGAKVNLTVGKGP